MLRLSAAVGLVFASLVAVAISVLSTNPPLKNYWPIIPVWVITSSLTYIGLCWPSVYRELMAHIADAEMNKANARQYRTLWIESKIQLPQAETVIDPNAQRLYRWVAFWADALEYVAENDDNFTYQGCLRNILTWPGFEGGFAEPLEDKGWLRIGVERASTSPAEGWTAARMLAEIGRGNYPPAPKGEPPAFRQTDPQNSENSGKKGRTKKTAATGYAADH